MKMESTLRAALVQYCDEHLAFIKANLSSPSVVQFWAGRESAQFWAARGLAQATFLRFPHLREE